jgi:dienelactone hydrolase/predicted Ser/Thr protein kinase
MNDERWTVVDRLLGAALEREPHERAEFLQEACADDEALRREVESLLAHHRGAGHFLESPALELLGTVPAVDGGPRFVGRQLGPYRILSLLGIGGMGEVYRAHDTKLARDVAIKVLRADLVGDDDRRAGIIREARAASTLNHPNIVTIYDIHEVDSVDFIVMEYVRGQSLDKMIPDRGLPVGRAVEYAVQIASAIETAHGAGIVHRDVKPANVVVTESGRVKVLDFGLAKLVAQRADPNEATATGTIATRAGTVLGTPAYMSPEQAQGLPGDAKSDVFSFGSMLYEMLAGRRPFTGETPLATLTAIVGQAPPPLKSVRAHVPADLQRLTDACLQKDPVARPAARDIVQRLETIQLRNVPTALALRRLLRRPVVAAPLLAFLAGVLGISYWWWSANARVRWARMVAIPEIQRLADKSDYDAAFRLARQAMEVLPDDPQLNQLWLNVTLPASITTDPPGADVAIKGYLAAGASWYPLGRTPLENVRLPLDLVRLRISKQGFESVEASEGSVATFTRGVSYRLDEMGKVPPGMVRAIGGSARFAGVTAQLSDFWIDRLEVTNQQFKEFLDAGGYRRREYWQEPFILDGRRLSWEEAIAKFRDVTGRPGPATWELGTFPEGRADFPVTGVSWYEAAAYAEFAGKSLSTGFHWHRAAGFRPVGDITAVSNFDGKGLAPAGSYGGLGPFGTYDMAGNVKEWASNQVGSRRALLGGAWNEPAYSFYNVDARSPFDREPNFGFRCVKYIQQPAATVTAPTPSQNLNLLDWSLNIYEVAKENRVGDEIFEVYRALYRYDRRPLNASAEGVDDTPLWRKEKVSFDAAYGNERVPAYLFLPKNASPPFQVVVAFAPFEAFVLRSSGELGLRWVDFIVRSGRGLLYPAYKGTYERGPTSLGVGPNAARDEVIAWSKDLGRAIDYLETRADIDRSRIAYYGVSNGGDAGLILTALEPRLRASVLQAGGPVVVQPPPEIDFINFVSRVRVPTLLVYGRNDFNYPVETFQAPLLRLLGTPSEHKRLATLAGGHTPARWQDVIREVLDWFDKYLGPVTPS